VKSLGRDLHKFDRKLERFMERIEKDEFFSDKEKKTREPLLPENKAEIKKFHDFCLGKENLLSW
jgi:hypothetical protein